MPWRNGSPHYSLPHTIHCSQYHRKTPDTADYQLLVHQVTLELWYCHLFTEGEIEVHRSALNCPRGNGLYLRQPGTRPLPSTVPGAGSESSGRLVLHPACFLSGLYFSSTNSDSPFAGQGCQGVSSAAQGHGHPQPSRADSPILQVHVQLVPCSLRGRAPTRGMAGHVALSGGLLCGAQTL